MATRRRIKPLHRRTIPVAIIAGCLLIVGVASAKMSTNSPITKNGQLQVAEWSVDVSSSGSGNMTLDAGNGSQTYSLTVTNNSEVASTYAIKVSNIPADVKIGLDITSASDMVTPVSGEVTFTNTGGDLGYTSPNNTRTHVLTLAAEPTANITQSSVNMSIEILFAQKEPQP